MLHNLKVRQLQISPGAIAKFFGPLIFEIKPVKTFKRSYKDPIDALEMAKNQDIKLFFQ